MNSLQVIGWNIQINYIQDNYENIYKEDIWIIKRKIKMNYPKVLQFQI